MDRHTKGRVVIVESLLGLERILTNFTKLYEQISYSHSVYQLSNTDDDENIEASNDIDNTANCL